MLTLRSQAVLSVLVDEYVSSASPVSSSYIAKHRDVKVSSATVRNTLVTLEENGYITRPHTSAGAIPLDRGYRLYLESVETLPEVSYELKQWAQQELSLAERDIEAWTRVAAMVLAQMVGNVAVATEPKVVNAHLKRLELVQIQDFTALLVIVIEEARLHQQLFTFSLPLTSSDMTRIANKLNSLMSGLDRKEIKEKHMDLTPVEEQVVSAVLSAMESEEEKNSTQHYVQGIRNLLSQPEFTTSNKAREAVEMLEDRGLVKSLIDEIPAFGTVRVIIGSENPEDVFRPYSLVMCQYGEPAGPTGLMSIMGPTRMDYRMAISSVQYVSAVLSRFMSIVYG